MDSRRHPRPAASARAAPDQHCPHCSPARQGHQSNGTDRSFSPTSGRRVQMVGKTVMIDAVIAPTLILRALLGRAALEILVEPADDVLQPLDAMPRLAGAGELVRLARELDHRCRHAQILERAEQLLATVAGRRAEVLLPLDE